MLGGGGGPARARGPGLERAIGGGRRYGLFCTDPFAFTVPGTIDVDGDGGPDSVQFSVDVLLPGEGALGAVKLTWRRQVSPQPAEATFGDVPLDSPYSPFIEALKASDITGGCQQAPLLYCPDRPITRAEMAVFVAKALGLHWRRVRPGQEPPLVLPRPAHHAGGDGRLPLARARAPLGAVTLVTPVTVSSLPAIFRSP